MEGYHIHEAIYTKLLIVESNLTDKSISIITLVILFSDFCEEINSHLSYISNGRNNYLNYSKYYSWDFLEKTSN